MRTKRKAFHSNHFGKDSSLKSEMNKTPYPNNFAMCDVNVQDDAQVIDAPDEYEEYFGCRLPDLMRKYTENPTFEPTLEPTIEPTLLPTLEPTVNPTTDPTDDPTLEPTDFPTIDPTDFPTINPTFVPSLDPNDGGLITTDTPNGFTDD